MKKPRDGMYAKFETRRLDGRDLPGGDKDGASYFVLDYAQDPYARIALSAYADACENDLPQLASDLRAELERTVLHAHGNENTV